MTNSLTQLPPVAKSFYSFCKKCDADRYHTVLAHTTSKTAKIKCEVCASTKSYSLPKTKTAIPGVAKKVSTSPRSVAARASAHQNEYESLSGKLHHKHVYSMKLQFKVGEGVDHPKFGLGIVTQCFADKVEVCFKDEVRTLVHNRN